MERFQSKYKIESTRLRYWNYAWPGLYFVTICTRNREHFFGQIQNGEMLLNEIGRIADQCWLQIPNHFQNTELGDFIIMPNHVHGLIIINGIHTDEREHNTAETGHALSLPETSPANKSQPTHFRFRNQGKNTVSAMVGSFKSAVTRLVRPINKNFG